MISIDEAIAQEREKAKDKRADADWKWRHGRINADDCIYSADEHEQLAEWLEKLKYIENIILKWNADWYNDEDTGIPDNEILEAIFNACTDNGFDIPVDEDFRKGYNKAIDDLIEIAEKSQYGDIKGKEYVICHLKALAEQLKAGEENA